MTIEETDSSWITRGGTPAAPHSGRLHPLGLREVRLRPGFWQQRQNTNRTASLNHIEQWLERAGWLGNFDAAAAGTLPGARRGREFSDTEVYKLLEAMAWEYGRTGDPGLDERYRAIVRRVAAAQEPDGYLNTNFGRPGQAPRYSDLEWGHELYSFGHLIQAGVARARTAGHDELVHVAVRAADHVCEVFADRGLCGHPEIEPALVELYRVTGERRYLDQARKFVDRRGHHELADIEFGRAYFQDDVPVRDAEILRGHAVRAAYLAAGAVDVAVETGDTALLDAVTRQWHATVARRTYLTGGTGSRHQDEAFGEDHVLPPDRAYSETCAAVGSMMLSWRLLLAHGDAVYADLIERTLFNVIATSPADDGRGFFYTNTLHQRVPGTVPDPGQLVPRAASSLRAPWFAVSCCPTNLARTFAGLAAYLATRDDDGLQIHQYAAATLATTLPGDRRVACEMDTEYPVDGRITIRVTESPADPWTLSLRVPAWAVGATLDGTPVTPGWNRLHRRFSPGDVVVLDLPVRARITTPDPRIDAVRGCVAVERGPLVLCAESVDLPVDVNALQIVPQLTERDGSVFATGRRVSDPPGSWPYNTSAFSGESAGEAPAGDPGEADGSGRPDGTFELPLHPYHRWARRGPSTMRVWLPLAPSAVHREPARAPENPAAQRPDPTPEGTAS
ncbi:glycoside hydrolase family 127 protein [Symbioplanes lichenis]|uniref:glycoside hydrolase family 127 protein n=1 Tax=Symbioplanes lichenis TaxID=1629072 RepID=UPI0027385D28|nr:beta-L-arabinofuranosidase domain-containing protein [Actinoplanes lichenis]